MSPSRVRATREELAVEVSDRQKILRVSPRWLARIVRAALRAQRVERAEIGIALVDDRRIAAVHGRWLGDAGPTDVITFDLAAGAGPRTAAGVVGDIVVSAETARRSARAAGWTPHRELAYYVVHGLLHLTGHDDRSPADRRAMRARERAVMKACGLPAPPRPVAGARGP